MKIQTIDNTSLYTLCFLFFCQLPTDRHFQITEIKFLNSYHAEQSSLNNGSLGVYVLFPLFFFSDGKSIKIMYGEAERRTLLNLIQAIDKDQMLLSVNKSAPVKMVKCELWKQVSDSFNDITGRNVSVEKLNRVLSRMKRNEYASGTYPRTYLEYDKDLKKWIFH